MREIVLPQTYRQVERIQTLGTYTRVFLLNSALIHKFLVFFYLNR